MSPTYLPKNDEIKERLILKDGLEIRKIDVHELIYVIYRDNHFLLFMENEILIMKGNFKDMLNQLPKQFVEINKQTIVNLDYLENILPEERKIIVNNSGYHKVSIEYLRFLCSAFRIKKQNTQHSSSTPPNLPIH